MRVQERWPEIHQSTEEPGIEKKPKEAILWPKILIEKMLTVNEVSRCSPSLQIPGLCSAKSRGDDLE